MFTPEISQKLTTRAKKTLQEAEKIALRLEADLICPEHLLLAIFLEKGSLGSVILKNLKVKKEDFERIFPELKKRIRKRNTRESQKNLPLSPLLKSVITRSYALASGFGYPYVGTEHLVYSIIESANKNVRQTINYGAFRKEILESFLHSAIDNSQFPNLSKIFDLPDITLAEKKEGGTSPTPFLSQFCVDINKETSEKGEFITGRDREIERIATILGRRNKNNPLLLGEPGVGKTAVVYGLAQKINSGDAPVHLSGKKIFSLDVALMVAGTSFRGEFETRLKEAIREAKEHPEIIIFIDEIHHIVGAGNISGGLDAANILKPALSRGEIRCIGATTFSEYKKHIERDAALERRFQPVRISEPTPEEAKEMIGKTKERYEKFHNIKIPQEIIDRAVELGTRFVPERFLPDKALDIIDESASAARARMRLRETGKKINELAKEKERIISAKSKLVREENYEEALNLRDKEALIDKEIAILKKNQAETEKISYPSISLDDIAKVVSSITGIPPEKISTGSTLKGTKILEKLSQHIAGQDAVLENLAKVLMRSYCGIANPNRPLGSFLFLGPTGVGKTFTAKILAQEIFENPKSLVRIDMSEFAERHNVSRLIGAPPGYIGFEEGGKLTEKIRHQPYSVVLFDEIEKAHPDVFNILLQILEEGMLTDAEGKEVNFKNAIIILTSNLGTARFTQAARIGFGSREERQKTQNFSEIKNQVLEELKRSVKPEILNRLDHIFVFNPLQKRNIEKITKIQLDDLGKRIEPRGIKFSYSKKLAEFIASRSEKYDQGARLVRKNIQDLVENEIASAIMEDKIKDGKISLDVKRGKIILT